MLKRALFILSLSAIASCSKPSASVVQGKWICVYSRFNTSKALLPGFLSDMKGDSAYIRPATLDESTDSIVGSITGKGGSFTMVYGKLSSHQTLAPSAFMQSRIDYFGNRTNYDSFWHFVTPDSAVEVFSAIYDGPLTIVCWDSADADTNIWRKLGSSN